MRCIPLGISHTYSMLNAYCSENTSGLWQHWCALCRSEPGGGWLTAWYNQTSVSQDRAVCKSNRLHLIVIVICFSTGWKWRRNASSRLRRRLRTVSNPNMQLESYVSFLFSALHMEFFSSVSLLAGFRYRKKMEICSMGHGRNIQYFSYKKHTHNTSVKGITPTLTEASKVTEPTKHLALRMSGGALYRLTHTGILMWLVSYAVKKKKKKKKPQGIKASWCNRFLSFLYFSKVKNKTKQNLWEIFLLKQQFCHKYGTTLKWASAKSWGGRGFSWCLMVPSVNILDKPKDESRQFCSVHRADDIWHSSSTSSLFLRFSPWVFCTFSPIHKVFGGVKGQRL